MKWLQITIAVFTIIGMLFTTHLYVERTYAKADQVELVEVRLDIKIQRDQSRDLRNQIWAIEDRYVGQAIPVSETKTLRNLREDKKEIDKDIDIMLQLQKSKN